MLHDDAQVLWKDFLDYYRCLSLAFERDADFEILVRNSWYFENQPAGYTGSVEYNVDVLFVLFCFTWLYSNELAPILLSGTLIDCKF